MKVWQGGKAGEEGMVLRKELDSKGYKMCMTNKE